jgi:hypothetical protein
MNCDTGELRRYSESLSSEERETFFRAFTEVPQNLQAEADKELGDGDSVFVNMEKKSPLVDWAKSQRNQPNPNGNRKHRRRMARESRKRNRG